MKLLTKEELQAERDAKVRSKRTELDRTKLAIVYVRQSGANAPTENKESRGAQLDDLVILATDEYDWPEASIVTIDENLLDKRGNTIDKLRGVSGRYGSDTRAGLRILEERIEKDEVGVIFIREPSRLFRDVDRDAALSFAKLCKRKHVVIVTPFVEYDMNISSRDDYKAFLDATAAAGDELKTLYRRMHAGKERVGMRGEYNGHLVPTGYMLDAERKYYVKNPYWCDIVARLIRRFRELDGNFSELFNEVRGVPIFPELPADIVARIGQIRLRHIEGGYTINRDSLKQLLCNPAYIGIKVFKQRIVKRDSHPAIVSRDDYDYAVAHLGFVDLDGNKLERGSRVKRFTQGQRREGLLSGIRSDGTPVITSTQGAVYVFQARGYTGYTIRDNSSLFETSYGSISIDTIDAAVSQRLEEKLSQLTWFAEVERDLGGDSRYGAQAVMNHVATLKQQASGSLVKLDESIKNVEKAIARKQREYEVAADVMSSEDIREHYSALKRLRERIAELREKQAQAAQVDGDIEVVASHFTRASQEWHTMTLEQRRSFLRLITETITLEALSDRWMKLIITWHPVLAGEPLAEVAIFYKANGSGTHWTPKEDALIREMYPQGQRDTILQTLPHRSWQSIRSRATTLKVRRIGKKREAGTLATLSIRDVELMAEYGITEYQVSEGQRVWWDDNNITGKGERWTNMAGDCSFDCITK